MDVDVKRLADATSELGLLTLKFGAVDRVTYYPDGKTRESDTDHTVMLGLVACALADLLYPDSLNVGMVAQFALVHDLPEVYAGDTCTLQLPTEDAKAAKVLAEALAQQKIEDMFDAALPWVGRMLRRYERQERSAARFVRVVDKLLPKILHQANNAATPIEQGMTPDELEARYAVQYEELCSYGHDFPELLALYQEMVRRELVVFRAAVAG